MLPKKTHGVRKKSLLLGTRCGKKNYIGININKKDLYRGGEAMNNQKLYNGLFRSQYNVIFQAVSLLMLFLALTAVQATAGAGNDKVSGAIKEMPGIGGPYGIWYLEDKRVQITEETVFKGDQSKATFGTRVVARGSKVNGVLVASEIEIRVDDGHEAFATN